MKRAPRKPKAPAPPAHDPHVAKALDYCAQVLDGRIPACKWVKLACKRQLDDLARSDAGDPSFPFIFDEAKAGRACRFLEQLPHVKGPKKGELFKLELWQCFIITTIFGWLRRSNRQRRFRRGYLEMPRGNGKSFMSSGVALYGLSADGEGGADVFSAATTTDQARIVWGDAEAMLKERPALKKKLGLRVTAHAIAQPATNSTFKALSRESKNQEGKNIHIAVVDELHAHPTRAVWDVLEMGAGKRSQSLIWAITTAGSDTSGICYEIRDGVVKMLDGAANEQLFGIIYTLDEKDDWKLEESWIKANPNWLASIDIDLFRMQGIEAIQNASKENNFKTKKLDIWCNADVAWMQMSAWDACADPQLKASDFAQLPCIDGLDLATKVDIAANVQLLYRDVPAGDDENRKPKFIRHYYLFLRAYLPEAAVERSKNAQYPGWVKNGHITTTPGDVLDFDAIKAGLRADKKGHDLREVAFDPFQAQQLANEMIADGFPMVEVGATVPNFSEPMKQLEALVLSKQLHHDGNPLMRWMISNVICHRDAKENIYPRKLKNENKIDGPVAAIMALNRAILAPVHAPDSYLSRRDLVTLG